MEATQINNETQDNPNTEPKGLSGESPNIPEINSNEDKAQQQNENTQKQNENTEQQNTNTNQQDTNTNQQDVKLNTDKQIQTEPISNTVQTTSKGEANASCDNNNIGNNQTVNNNNNKIGVSQTLNNTEPTIDGRDLFDSGFVLIDADEEFKYEKHRQSFYNQMETLLNRQINQCEYYKKFFDEQSNVTMANKFAAYSLNSTKNLDLLKLSWKNNEMLPKYKFEHISFSCIPVNAYIRDKEVQITVKASNLPVPKGSVTYIIGEFEYPHSKDEPMTDTITRWFRYSTIDPKNAVSCCTNADPRQLDSIYSSDIVPFTDPECKQTLFNRPLSFFIEKGKSKTLKRKFKLVRLTFYEKKDFFSFDKKIGTLQLKIDGINDDISIVTRQHIMDGRRPTEASVDMRVRVREALVNRSIRAHEEKLLLLT